MKTRSKILFVLVLLLVLGFIFLMPHGRYRHELEVYKQQLLDRGEKLTMTELAPPPSNDPSNGALAFMQLMNNYKLPTNLPLPMRLVAPGLANMACTNVKPSEMFGYESNLSKAVKLRVVLNASSVLEFNLDYSQGYRLRLPHLIKLRSAALLLSGTAMQAYNAKNSSEARSDVLAAADLFRLYNNEPVIISDLFRANLARIALGATWESLHSDSWTDSQLGELQAKWQEPNLFVNAYSSIPVHRVSGMAEFDELRKTGMALGIPFGDSLAGNFGRSEDDGVFASAVEQLNSLYGNARFSLWKSSWSYDEELCFLQLEDVESEISRQANAADAFAPEFKRLNQNVSNIAQLHSGAMDHYLIIDYILGSDGDSLGDSLLRLAETETARRLCVTAIALKRYHLKHGVYPATLNELVPAFLPAVPTDFMDGKPLRYELRPDGDFLLYSVGEDGKDDGGDPTPVSQPASSTSFNWLAGRDIVWPRVATPAALEEYHRLHQSLTNPP